MSLHVSSSVRPAREPASSSCSLRYTTVRDAGSHVRPKSWLSAAMIAPQGVGAHAAGWIEREEPVAPDRQRLGVVAGDAGADRLGPAAAVGFAPGDVNVERPAGTGIMGPERGHQPPRLRVHGQPLIPVEPPAAPVARHLHVVGPGGAAVARQPQVGRLRRRGRVLVLLPALVGLGADSARQVEHRHRAGRGRHVRRGLHAAPRRPGRAGVGGPGVEDAHRQQTAGPRMGEGPLRSGPVDPEPGCRKRAIGLLAQREAVDLAGRPRPVIGAARVVTPMPGRAAIPAGLDHHAAVGALARARLPEGDQYGAVAERTHAGEAGTGASAVRGGGVEHHAAVDDTHVASVPTRPAPVKRTRQSGSRS